VGQLQLQRATQLDAVGVGRARAAQILAVGTDRPYVAGMALMTADQLLVTSLPNKRTELVRGVLVVREPAGFRHGAVSAALTKRLAQHVDTNRLGQVVAAETGFRLASDPDTVRAPDVGFVRAERVPQPEPAGYPALAPDLVVEVLSPDDRPGETLTKVGEWLTAGTRLVWVVDPVRRLACVYRANGSEAVLEESESLDGEDVVPGFSCRLGEIL
jgi:Uma2 family endonuclease